MKIKIYSTLFLLLFTCFANAQAIPTPAAGPPPPPGGSIDGGILLLFITGVIYGVKKLKE